MSDEPVVWISWPAQVALRERFPWHDELELGGGLFGYWEGNRVNVLEAYPNPSGPDRPDATRFDWDVFRGCERAGVPTPDDEFRVVGDVHSHRSPGRARASSIDLSNWEAHSSGLRQPWCGLVVAPGRGDVWSEGYPTDRLDWGEPVWRAWVAIGGVASPARLVLEDEWIYELAKTNSIRFQPRRSTSVTT